MLKAIFNWFTGKPVPGTEAPAVKAESAPYKVESPLVVKVSEPVPVVTAPKLVVDGHGDVHEVAPVPKTKRVPAEKQPRAPAKPRAKKPPTT